MPTQNLVQPCIPICSAHKYHCNNCYRPLTFSPANYASRPQDIPNSCEYCFPQQISMPTQNWRDNILDNLKNSNMLITGAMLNAIDAAYTAGLDDFTSKLKGIREEIDKEAEGNDDYTLGLKFASSILTRWIGK